MEKKITGIEAFLDGSCRLCCALGCALGPVSVGYKMCLAEVAEWPHFPWLGLGSCIQQMGMAGEKKRKKKNNKKKNSRKLFILLVFYFLSSLMGGNAVCTLAVGSQWTMPSGRHASLFLPMVFYHLLILLILASLKPRAWTFFSTHWNWTWKHFHQCKSLKPLFIHPGKAFSWYADNDRLYYVYLLAISPSAIDSVSRFPGARFNFQPQ